MRAQYTSTSNQQHACGNTTVSQETAHHYQEQLRLQFQEIPAPHIKHQSQEPLLHLLPTAHPINLLLPEACTLHSVCTPSNPSPEISPPPFLPSAGAHPKRSPRFYFTFSLGLYRCSWLVIERTPIESQCQKWRSALSSNDVKYCIGECLG